MLEKLKLKPALIARLQSCRAEISAAHCKADKVVRRYEDLEKQRQSVAIEIEKLEKAKNISDRQTRALLFKREKLRQIDNRLNSQPDPGGPEIILLRNALIDFNRVFLESMSGVHDALALKILTALEPFYSKQRLGIQLAQDSCAMRSLANFLSNRFGMASNPIANAKTALAIIDQLLAGKNPWVLKL